MSVNEFENCKIVDKEDKLYYVVSVKDHKTAAEHGPANVVLPEEIYELYDIYKRRVGEQIMNSFPGQLTIDGLFVTWSGKKITSDDINKGIQRVWALSGLKSKIGCNMIRKTTTTKVHSTKPEFKEVVARQMAHRVSTAERNYKYLYLCYKLKTRAEQSVEASVIITKTMREGGVYDDDAPDDEESYKSNEEPFPSMDNDASPPTIYLNERSQESVIPKRSKGRPFYSEIERNILKEVFDVFVSEGIVPRLSAISRVIEEDERLTPLKQLNKCQPLKIKGALQNLANKKKLHG